MDSIFISNCFMRILTFIQNNKIKLAKYYVVVFIVFVLLFPFFLLLSNQFAPAGPDSGKGGHVRNFSTPFVCHSYPGIGDGMASEWYCEGRFFLENLFKDLSFFYSPFSYMFFIYIFFTNPFLLFLDLIFISLLVFLFVNKRKSVKIDLIK